MNIKIEILKWKTGGIKKILYRHVCMHIYENSILGAMSLLFDENYFVKI